MRAYPCLYILAAALACGPGPGSSSDTSSTAGTDSGTSQNPVTTGDPVTTTSGEPTTTPTPEPTTASTTADPSDATTLPGTSATSDATVIVETTAFETTGTTTSDDTGTPVDACEKDADCKLQDDCCVCAGIPNDLDPVPCDGECKQSKCSELGIDQAVCRLGVCETERLSCDQNKVACDALPPDCPEGQLPTTTPACWTGNCVPAELCDVVPDCKSCPAGHLCVQLIAFGPTETRCEPIPPACGDDPDCACAGDACPDGFALCTDQPGPAIDCECPNC